MAEPKMEHKIELLVHHYSMAILNKEVIGGNSYALKVLSGKYGESGLSIPGLLEVYKRLAADPKLGFLTYKLWDTKRNRDWVTSKVGTATVEKEKHTLVTKEEFAALSSKFIALSSKVEGLIKQLGG